MQKNAPPDIQVSEFKRRIHTRRVGAIGCLMILCGVIGMNVAPAMTASVGGAVVYLNVPFHIGFMSLTVFGVLLVLYAIARGR
ncbi:MAG: hypothetical protein VB131_10150 [Burkholderia gladioli]